MTESEIRALLKAKGATMTSIAEAVSVSETSVRRVISNESKSRRIANVIALFLGKKVDELWPNQYPEQYSRRTPERISRELRAAVMSVDQARAA